MANEADKKSFIRENFYNKNINAAQTIERETNYNLNKDLNKLYVESASEMGPYLEAGSIIGFIVGGTVSIVFQFAIALFMIFNASIFIFLYCWRFKDKAVKFQNLSIKNEIFNLENEVRKTIEEAYKEADRKTDEEIAAYNKEVEHYYEIIPK